MRYLYLMSFILFTLIEAVNCQAGPMVYTLTGHTNPIFSDPPYSLGPVHAEGFQYTAPDSVTSVVFLSAFQLDYCVSCLAIEFFPNGSLNTDPRDQISFTDVQGVIYGFFFSPGAFSTPGTYIATGFPDIYTTSNIGTLTVQPLPDPSTGGYSKIFYDPVTGDIVGIVNGIYPTPGSSSGLRSLAQISSSFPESISEPSPAPEPSTASVVGLAMIGIAAAGLTRRSQ